jgi:hypothetical protein
MSNYKDWINNSNIEIDYYSLFIKAWIGFNSWYRNKYNKITDRKSIDKIKEEPNDFKTHIKNLLSNDNQESENFRVNVSKLHESLCLASIATQEINNSTIQVLFTNIAYKNSNNKIDSLYRYNKYLLERKNDKITIKIMNKNNFNIIFDLEQENYNKIELTSNSKYISLNNECKGQLLYFYDQINPYNNMNIISSTALGKKIGTLYFVNDDDKISVGIIEVLYLLRCSLFHGDVSINEGTKKVYKYAYEILFAILKNLI